MLRCKDLKSLSSLKDIEYVAGKDGIDKIIRWSYVTETKKFSNWVHGDELLIISGISQTEGYNLLSLINEGIRSKMSGALVLMGENYETNISDEVIKLADISKFPIMTISWKIPLVDILEDIGRAIVKSNNLDRNKENIISNIIFSDFFDSESLIEECRLLEYNLNSPQQMIMIQFDNDTIREKFSSNTLYSIDRKTHIKDLIKGLFLKESINTLISDCGNNIIVMCESELKEDYLNNVLENIKTKIIEEYNDLNFNIGVSSVYTEVSKLKSSFKEASKCIALLNKLSYKNMIYYYDKLGLYKLFLEIDKEDVLKKYYYNLLGHLLEYDEKNDTFLVETLRNYLEQNCNIIQTSKVMFVHRNTLKYRIQRIEEITKKSLNDSYTRLEFQNALLIQKISH